MFRRPVVSVQMCGHVSRRYVRVHAAVVACVCDSAASITFHQTTHASGRQPTCIACWGREGTYSHVDAYAAAHTRFTRACMEWRQQDNDVHFSTSSCWHQIKAPKDRFQTTLCLKSVWNTEDSLPDSGSPQSCTIETKNCTSKEERNHN